MSKTQKIILIIGVGLIGLSLVLLLVNTVLKNRNNNSADNTNETNLFSLFERPITVNKNEPVIPTEPVTETPTDSNTEQIAVKNQTLISEQPVFNFIPIEKTVDQISFSPDKKIPETKVKKSGVRYVKYNGVIYEKYEGEPEQRISNTVTERLGEVFLYGDGIVYRYSREDMQTIETYVGMVSKKEPNIGVTTGGYLPKNIRSFALNENSGKFAGVLADEARQSAQILIGAIGKNERTTLLKTSFTDWLVDWLDDSNLILTSRASKLTTGSAYIVNTKDSSKTKITSGLGLTTKALPFGAGVIVSTIIDNKYETQIYQNKKFDYLPLKTIADKCTAIAKNIIACAVPGGDSGAMLDDWYKGEVNYDDTIITYNTETGTQKVLLSGGIDVDIIKPSTNGEYIYFRNKLNGLLYKVKTN